MKHIYIKKNDTLDRANVYIKEKDSEKAVYLSKNKNKMPNGNILWKSGEIKTWWKIKQQQQRYLLWLQSIFGKQKRGSRRVKSMIGKWGSIVNLSI